MKQYSFKNLFLTGLSMILLFSSCQMKQRDDVKNQKDLVSEILYEPTNTITVDDQTREEEYPCFNSLVFAQVMGINDTSQISIFDTVCAVSVIPDTSWLTKRQSEVPEDHWDEIVSGAAYYDYMAQMALQEHNIPTYYVPREKRYVKFIKADNSYFMIDLTKMLDAWGLILFNGKDSPILWHDTDVDRELKEYYKK